MVMPQFPNLVGPLDQKTEAFIEEELLVWAAEYWDELCDYFDAAISGFWKEPPRFRRGLYEQHLPIFVLPAADISAWLAPMDEGLPFAVEPPVVQMLLQYYGQNMPREPLPLPAQVDPATGQPAYDPMQVQQYQAARQQWQEMYRKWQERIIRLEAGEVMPQDLLTGWWAQQYENEPKQGVRYIRDYASILKADEKKMQADPLVLPMPSEGGGGGPWPA
ncbi:MAG: hypothetical protein A3E01_15345 [Gammaproteobacteria bacterium RIFCSPHIGHO2_12_FULL_63_22]|nr:MAG: hypothetical protein A3E01_15345 [Gammaproteobacteria bacterium RIFCSPHIGHO2_12_FULL_63_22]